MTLMAAVPHLRTALLSSALLATPWAMAVDTAPLHWGYDDAAPPAQWATVAPACSGDLQSPIDLWSSAIAHDGSRRLQAAYRRSHFSVVNNGHTLQATPQNTAANTIELDGETFTLTQFHVHTPSEHTVNGKTHDMALIHI